MPLQVNTVLEQLRTFTWKYMGEDIEIEYNQMGYTPAFEEDLHEIADEEMYATALAAVVCQTVTKWEIEWEGEAVPLNPSDERFKKIPFKILFDLMQAVGEDNAPDEAEGKAFGGGSRRMANRETRRRAGTRSSKPQGI